MDYKNESAEQWELFPALLLSGDEGTTLNDTPPGKPCIEFGGGAENVDGNNIIDAFDVAIDGFTSLPIQAIKCDNDDVVNNYDTMLMLATDTAVVIDSSSDSSIAVDLPNNTVNDAYVSTLPAADHVIPKVKTIVLLEDHHVVLKSKRKTTTATGIFKKHVRHLYGRKQQVSDRMIQKLKILQGKHYEQESGGGILPTSENANFSTTPIATNNQPSVSFWVPTASVGNNAKEWVTDQEDVRYLILNDEQVPFWPASDECLRDELRMNGGSPDRRKRKKKNAPPSYPLLFLDVKPPGRSPRFALQVVKNLHEMFGTICRLWVDESDNVFERTLKGCLVKKVKDDLLKYDRFVQDNSVPMHDTATKDYDRFYEQLQRSLIVDIANRLGNGMVQWYDQHSSKSGGGGGGSGGGGGPPENDYSSGDGPPGPAGRDWNGSDFVARDYDRRPHGGTSGGATRFSYFGSGKGGGVHYDGMSSACDMARSLFGGGGAGEDDEEKEDEEVSALSRPKAAAAALPRKSWKVSTNQCLKLMIFGAVVFMVALYGHPHGLAPGPTPRPTPGPTPSPTTISTSPMPMTMVDKMDSLELKAVEAFGQVFALDTTEIELPFLACTGTIPAELGLLTALTALDMQRNSLNGTLPSELGLLTLLTEVDLSFNSLSGTIPTELGSMASIVRLSLSANNLTGAIPTELGYISALSSLRLYNNTLTGPIPKELELLSSLTHLFPGVNPTV